MRYKVEFEFETNQVPSSVAQWYWPHVLADFETEHDHVDFDTLAVYKPTAEWEKI